MQIINGGCHCGNIRFEFLWPLEGPEIPVRACSCTFCIKHKGTYTSHPQAQLKATIRDLSSVTKYVFGTESADFFICSQCGVLPFVTSTIRGRDYAVVNVNAFEDIDFTRLKPSVSNFDGETIEDRLGRRQRTWIPNVRVL